MKDYKKQLGQVIRIYREKLGYSQETLGLKVGVTQQTINAYELGKSSVYLDKAMNIADVLDIPMSKFFEDTGTRDLLEEFGEDYDKYSEVIDILNANKKLVEFLEIYKKNSKSLKDVDFTKLAAKLASYPTGKKQTALNILMKGKL